MLPRAVGFLTLCLLGFALNVSAECIDGCSGHGTCGARDMCTCFATYIGNDCSQRVCPFGRSQVDIPIGDLDSDGSLSSTKVVLGSQLYPFGAIELYPDATQDEGHFYAECSSAGTCDRARGECVCFPGFEGSSCDRSSCPPTGDDERKATKCSGHGTCQSIRSMGKVFGPGSLFGVSELTSSVDYNLWDANSTYGCVCDPGFYGHDCSEKRCAYGVDPLYANGDGVPTYDRFQLFIDATVNITAVPSSKVSGVFKLRLFDFDGESYVTRDIPVEDVYGSLLTTSAFAQAVEDAIASLPGDYFDGVNVYVPGASPVADLRNYISGTEMGFHVIISFDGIPGYHRLPELAEVKFTTRNDGVNLITRAAYGVGSMADSFVNKASAKISAVASATQLTLASEVSLTDLAIVPKAPSTHAIYRLYKSGAAYFLGYVMKTAGTALVLPYSDASTLQYSSTFFTSNKYSADIVRSPAFVKRWLVGNNKLTVPGDFRYMFRKNTQFVFHNQVYNVQKDSEVTDTGSFTSVLSPRFVPLAVVCDTNNPTFYLQTPVNNMEPTDIIVYNAASYIVSSISSCGRIISATGTTCTSTGAVLMRGKEIVGPIIGAASGYNGTITVAAPFSSIVQPGDIVSFATSSASFGSSRISPTTKNIRVAAVETQTFSVAGSPSTFYVVYADFCSNTLTVDSMTFCIRYTGSSGATLHLEARAPVDVSTFTGASPVITWRDSSGVSTTSTTGFTVSALTCRSGSFSGRTLCTITVGGTAPGYGNPVYGPYIADTVGNVYSFVYLDGATSSAFVTGTIEEKILGGATTYPTILPPEADGAYLVGAPTTLKITADFQIGNAAGRSMTLDTFSPVLAYLNPCGTTTLLASVGRTYVYRRFKGCSGQYDYIVPVNTVITVDKPFSGDITTSTNPSPSIYTALTGANVNYVPNDITETNGIYLIRPEQSSTDFIQAIARVQSVVPSTNKFVVDTLATAVTEYGVYKNFYFQGQFFHVVTVQTESGNPVITTAEYFEGTIDWPGTDGGIEYAAPSPATSADYMYRVTSERTPITLSAVSCDVTAFAVGSTTATMTCTGTPTVGGKFILFSTRYTVTALSGAGPYTVTTDKVFYGVPLHATVGAGTLPIYGVVAAAPTIPLASLSQSLVGSSASAKAYFYTDGPSSALTDTTISFGGECSLRGSCNSDTGECACYTGYTGNVCNSQNSLAKTK